MFQKPQKLWLICELGRSVALPNQLVHSYDATPNNWVAHGSVLGNAHIPIPSPSCPWSDGVVTRVFPAPDSSDCITQTSYYRLHITAVMALVGYGIPTVDAPKVGTKATSYGKKLKAFGFYLLYIWISKLCYPNGMGFHDLGGDLYCPMAGFPLIWNHWKVRIFPWLLSRLFQKVREF